MKRRFLQLALAGGLVLALTGCAENLFLAWNLEAGPPAFSGVDTDSADTATTDGSKSFLTSVAATSDNVNDGSTTDATTARTIAETVETATATILTDEGVTSGNAGDLIPTDPTTITEEQRETVTTIQRATATAATLVVNSDPGAVEVVGNVTNVLTSLIGDTSTTGDTTTEEFDVDAALGAVFGDLTAEGNEDALASTLASLAAASSSFETLGETFVDRDGDGGLDVVDDSISDTAGDIAQTAIVSILVGTTLEALDDPNDTTDDPIAKLTTILTADDGDDTTTTTAEADAQAYLDAAFTSESNPFTDLTAEGSATVNYINLLGLGDLFTGGDDTSGGV